MPVKADAVRNWRFDPVTEIYDERRTILYALGVGAAATGAESDLQLVYEKELKALPSMAVILAGEPMWMSDPRTGITFTHVLHGEQGLTLEKPLPARGTLVGQTSIEGLYDKAAKGAVLVMKRELREADSGTLVATVRSSAFMRADGGFGGSSEGQAAPHPMPQREPDVAVSLSTRVDQAVVYRLSGDFNPLHVDPEVAKQAGFPKPILHGLCSYGIACRAIVTALCDANPDRLTRFDVRFSTPVFPGETLITEIWRESPGHAAFRVKIAERGVVALSNGRADYLC